jgi:multiple antibiotic resistance protein
MICSLILITLILRITGSINRLLGQRGSMIVTRVFAVIVAAIAVQYIIQGTGKTIVDMRLNM